MGRRTRRIFGKRLAAGGANTSSPASACRAPPYGLGRASSGAERGERRHHHPVGPGVAVADSDNHHERGRWAGSVRLPIGATSIEVSQHIQSGFCTDLNRCFANLSSPEREGSPPRF